VGASGDSGGLNVALSLRARRRVTFAAFSHSSGSFRVQDTHQPLFSSHPTSDYQHKSMRRAYPNPNHLSNCSSAPTVSLVIVPFRLTQSGKIAVHDKQKERRYLASPIILTTTQSILSIIKLSKASILQHLNMQFFLIILWPIMATLAVAPKPHDPKPKPPPGPCDKSE
jgi:hypothetical protein